MKKKLEFLLKKKLVQNSRVVHFSKMYMKVNRFFIILLSLFSFIQSFAQTNEDDELKKRQEKIEIILRMQDTRTIFDGKLISLLNDKDSLVRRRVVYAFGSIQDTSVISLLFDRLDDTITAFAIGQIAPNLSQTGRISLAHDLIWSRMKSINSLARAKLIEEIGKFGTEEALSDLLNIYGETSDPIVVNSLTMSIARFAIRGITTREAVQYLLKMIKPIDNTPWQVVYALQRIGNNPEVHSNLEMITPLFKHSNPLVRMNLATLLGKVRNDKICLEPLQKLAEFDVDWRVRVNALKALSNYNLRDNDEIIRIFKRAFYSGNTNLAITAINAFGNTKLKKEKNPAASEAILSLEKIAVNKNNDYMWQLQAEAAIAVAKLEGDNAFKIIKPTEYPQSMLQEQLLIALGMTGSKEALSVLSSNLDVNKPRLYRAALEGMSELVRRNRGDSSIVESVYKSTLTALKANDVAVITTAASILGDSIFQRNKSVDPLIETLSNLRVPDDIEAIQEIISVLGKLKDRRAEKILKNQLEQRDRSIINAAIAALKLITGNDYSSEAPKYFEPLYTDFDFKYLNSLRDTIRVKVETIRGDIVIDLYKNIAPFSVMSFLKLASQRGFYRGLSFHRIVPNFVIQGGDPRGDGWGGPGYTIRSEFSPLTFETGMVGLASSGKDTEGSQFFITQSPQPHLDGRYTIIGKVVHGMNVVNKIQLDDHIFDVKIIEAKE